MNQESIELARAVARVVLSNQEVRGEIESLLAPSFDLDTWAQRILADDTETAVRVAKMADKYAIWRSQEPERPPAAFVSSERGSPSASKIIVRKRSGYQDAISEELLRLGWVEDDEHFGERTFSRP